MADEAQERKEFNDKIIAKIQEDPDFLGHLLDDAEGTLKAAGLIPESFEAEDVEGHAYVGLLGTHHRR